MISFSDRRLQIVIGILALIGVAISGYLTYVRYSNLSPICLTGGCEAVQSSKYSAVLGIPVALIGIVGYVLILVTLFMRGNSGRLLGVIFSFVGVGYSLYLTYLELFQIHAICQWCVASAIVIAPDHRALPPIRYLRPE